VTRAHLVLTWDEPPAVTPAPAGVVVRGLTTDDAEALGSLFWQGFQDEDAYDSLAAARTEAIDTVAGVWGPVTWEASLLALSDDEPLAASVVLADDAHDGLPLLAYVVTLPAARRQGIGRALILAGIDALHTHGVRELHLAVLPSNPAVALYTKLGFLRAAPD
jgi:ribosomal protein S18 acetylase RimI-like enzyme